MDGVTTPLQMSPLVQSGPSSEASRVVQKRPLLTLGATAESRARISFRQRLTTRLRSLVGARVVLGAKRFK